VTKRLCGLGCLLGAALGGCALLPVPVVEQDMRHPIGDDVPAMMRLLKPGASVHALRMSVTSAESNA
jgi:hypothetical protein